MTVVPDSPVTLHALMGGLVDEAVFKHAGGQIEADLIITGLAMDSRKVEPGYLFFAHKGATVHGADYAAQALANGAIAIVYDVSEGERINALSLGIPCLPVVDLSAKIGACASRFYRQPSQHQTVIGITGTNGKTSCSHFLAQVLARCTGSCGLIGTLGYGLYGQTVQGEYTTPDAVRLQAELAAMYADGAHHVVMEVSSHALSQDRVSGVAFDVAILTNLSQDHLDYHGDMDGYAAAKQRLFEMQGLRYAVLNQDDDFGRRLVNQIAAPVKVLSYGTDHPADVRGVVQRFDAHGFTLAVMTPWGNGELNSRLLGRFNVSNVLAVLATLLILDIPLEQALAQISQISPVRGRMEHFGGGADKPLVVVDYAHTPDALEQVLLTLRAHCRRELWCVFGCGGDRDASKRAMMGAIAERNADHVILTDDNPRHESGAAIIKNILDGVGTPERVLVKPDRAEAISYAVSSASNSDVVLVAGKGHEEYQLVGDLILPFSDRRYVAELLGEAA